jgi:Family of unknown function (DUF6504)
MRGNRPEPVGVSLRQGRPARFVWRGRLYTVLLVLDRRVMPSPARPVTDTEPAGQSQPAGQEVWLVEATPQHAVAASRFELCQDLANGQWTLSRA